MKRARSAMAVVALIVVLACGSPRTAPPVLSVDAVTHGPAGAAAHLAEWCDADSDCRDGYCDYGVCRAIALPEPPSHVDPGPTYAQWHSEACWSTNEQRLYSAYAIHPPCKTLGELIEHCALDVALDCVGAARLLEHEPHANNPTAASYYFGRACKLGRTEVCQYAP